MKVNQLRSSVVSPFRLDYTTWALRRRERNTIDNWNGRNYTRILAFEGDPIKVSISQGGTQDEPDLAVILQWQRGREGEEVLYKSEMEIMLLIKKMLGLDVDLMPFYALAKEEDKANNNYQLHGNNGIIKQLSQQFRGVKPPRYPTIFEAMINAVACQQVTLDLAILILNKLAERFGLAFEEEENNKHDDDSSKQPQSYHAFPRPEDLANVSVHDLRKLGFSHQKANAIRGIAAIMVEDETKFEERLYRMTNEQVVHHLSSFRGIGRWSAEYVLLRGMGRVDIFPGDDVGAQNNLRQLLHLDKNPGYEGVKNFTSRWHPYEGLVYFHLLLYKLQNKGYISPT